MTKIVGTVLIFAAMAVNAMATVSVVPEIDPASGMSAVAVIAGAILVVRSRRKARN